MPFRITYKDENGRWWLGYGGWQDCLHYPGEPNLRVRDFSVRRYADKIAAHLENEMVKKRDTIDWSPRSRVHVHEIR